MTFRHYHRKWRIWHNKFSISKLVKKITPLMLAVLMSKNVDGQGLPLYERSFNWVGGYPTKYLDVDQDGDIDILYHYVGIYDPGYYFYYTYFFENKGNKLFPNFEYFNGNSLEFDNVVAKSNLKNINGIRDETYKFYNVQFFDFDKDSDKDLFLFGFDYAYEKFHLRWHKNSQKIFSIDSVQLNFLNLENSICQITQVEHINNDDYFDFIFEKRYGPGEDSTFYLLNEGTNDLPTFDIEKRHFLSEDRAKLVDIDNDGNLDLCKYKYSSYLYQVGINYFKGLQSNDLPIFDNRINVLLSLEHFNPINGRYQRFSVDVIDIDLDGDIDIIGTGCNTRSYGSSICTDFFLENIGVITNEIVGKVKIDLNGDGNFSEKENFNKKLITLIDNNGEPYTQTITFHKLSNHPIVVENLDYIFPVNEYGSFTLYPMDGEQKIYPKPVPNFEFEPPFYTYNFLADTNILVSDVQFVMKPIAGRYDVEVDISGLATRPGFETKQYLYYKNLAGNPTNGTLSFTPPAELTVLSAQPNYDRTESGAYYWDIEDLQALESEQVEVNLQVDVNAVLNTPIQSVVGFELTNGTDFNPLNNTDTLFGRITGSFDPNDKLVTPSGLDGGLTAVTDQPFEYTIRFQNMGNDTAFTVIITDTLDIDFNLSSFEMVGSSHNYELSVRDNNVLIRKFRNILLPPSSTNLTGSQGFVKYRFTPKEGADIGTIFTNKADIYFDYNTPVVTNETRNIFGVISGIHNHQHQQDIVSKAYPNPTKNKLLIEFNNAEKQDVIITIYDIEGQQILQKTIQEGFFSFDVHNLSAGTYLYTIESVSAFGKGKFIKE